jgi:glycine cleavage system H protein
VQFKNCTDYNFYIGEKMEVLDNLRYTENHEWVRVEGEFAYLGITFFAQRELGEIVHVELPEAGEHLNVGDHYGTLEAVKTVEDLYTPISGEVITINSDIIDSPDLINRSPYEDGWLIKLRYTDKGEIEKLFTPEEYKKRTGA